MLRKKEKMKENKYISSVWDGINIFFSIATIFTSATFIILFVLCFTVSVKHDAYGTIIGMCGVFASLASAFFIAVFIRYFEMKKKRKSEINAVNILKPYLLEIHTVINTFLPQIKAFATIKENNMIVYSRERVYYKDEDRQARSFIDFDDVFKTADKELNSALKKALLSPMISLCNENLVELLTKIQLNGFTHNLKETQSMIDVFDPMTITYGDLFENYSELLELYTELTELIGENSTKRLKILNGVDRELYIKEIGSILPQLPPHNGTIYKGIDRIK